jgi:hypothetical protein
MMTRLKFKEKLVRPTVPSLTDPSFTAVKWLVPSVGILFALVGYVIDCAQRSLLAFPTDDARLDNGDRVQNAAEFLRFLFTVIGDRLLTLGSLKGFSLGGHGSLLFALTLAVVAVLVAPVVRDAKNNALRVAATALTCVLPLATIALLTVKFVYFDAPVMRIESAVVGIGVPKIAIERGIAASVPSSAASSDSVITPLNDRLRAAVPAPIGDLVSDRALSLWRLMSCSRIAGENMNHNFEFGSASGVSCEAPNDKNLVVLSTQLQAKEMLAGEFDASLWMGVLIVLTSAALLRARTVQNTALAVVALVYLLTIPYAWGKLLKPVDFSYALIRGADNTFIEIDDQNELKDMKSTYAFVLGRDSGYVTLLQGVREPCSNGFSTAVRFSSVPASKIVAIEQIFRLDVINWALRKQSKCPIEQGPQRPG